MLLKRLTEAMGLPGFEKEVREIIKEELSGHVDRLYTDRIGNLIAIKNGNATGPHTVLCAHMDEVGMVVKGIDATGLIRFGSWGCDPRVLVSKQVKVGDKKINGVIGSKPIHQQKPEERTKAHTVDDMYIDIGLFNKADAEKLVSVGDYVGFATEYREFGDNKAMSKALDDRVGCAAIIEVLKSDTKSKITAVFTAQEEVGCRGSAVASNNITADIAIIVEGTICADTIKEEHDKSVTYMGKGPAVSLLDRGTVYRKDCVERVLGTAQAQGIPIQVRRTGMGGTDAMRFSQAKEGMAVIGLAVPCRYIHSPVSVVDLNDYENLIKLLKALV